MRVRGVVLSLTALLVFSAALGAAEAGDRKKLRRAVPPPDNYYSGPGFVHRIPGLRVFFGDYALSPEEFDKLYGDGSQFDESYYEPQPLATAKPKAKPTAKSAKLAPAAKTPASTATASIERASSAAPVQKKPIAKASPSPAAKPVTAASLEDDETPVQSNAEPAAKAETAGSLSCGKATSVIAGYGFSAIKPESCNGKIFAFNANRDGRQFAIKIDAVNGELTEVKKLN